MRDGGGGGRSDRGGIAGGGGGGRDGGSIGVAEHSGRRRAEVAGRHEAQHFLPGNAYLDNREARAAGRSHSRAPRLVAERR